jgi:hypothetical protein
MHRFWCGDQVETPKSPGPKTLNGWSRGYE